MRALVILGIVLIVVSIFIARFALDQQTPSASAKNANAAKSSPAPDRIACWGYFEVEGGVAQLDAKQLGDVVFVAKENVPVHGPKDGKPGELLLQLNDDLVQIKVKQAQAAVDAATLQVKEVEKLTEHYKLQKKLQGLAIEAVKGKVRALKLKEERDSDLLESASLAKRESARRLYEEGFKGLKIEQDAEEAKLAQLNLQDADLKIDLAKADLRAKTLMHQEALESLKLFKITAPSDGIVLRAYYRKGEVVAPNPMKHAIEFLPKADIIVRAEVLQEWGRYIKDPAQSASKQEVEIVDDTYAGQAWKGEVLSISKWYAPTRSPVIEPFRYNDVRTMEIVIKVNGVDNVKIGQRVRAMVKIQ
jgi:multidrug resistance efflux pump